MNLTFGIGFTDKTLLALVMLAAMLLYTKRVAWNRKGIPFFLLTLLGILGLNWGVEWMTRAYPLPIDNLYVTNAYDIILVFLCILAVRFLKQFDRDTGIFAACAAYATVCFSNALFTLVNFFLVGPKGLLNNVGVTREIAVRAIVFFVTYTIVFLLCNRFLVAKQENAEYAVDRSVYLIFFFIFASNLFFGSMDDDVLYFVTNLNKLLFSILVLFLLFRQARMLRLREENARLIYIMETQRAQFEAAKRSVEEVNLKAHDIKHFVDLFSDRKSIPQPVLETLREAYDNYENTYDTGSQALDITLTEKCKSFSKEQITFTVMANGAMLSLLSDVDIYVLFGNLLENAREAVLEIEEPDLRIIGLYVRRAEHMVSIHVENTVRTAPAFSNGLPVTTKKDTVNHGFGTKSIRTVVERYGGSVTMSCDGKLFSTDIAFPIAEP